MFRQKILAKAKTNVSLKNKRTATIFALLIITCIAIPISALPSALAHNPAWQIPTTAYINVAPNPVGVGQRVSVVMWAGLVLPGAAVENDVRFHDYKLVITKPDATTETMTWSIVKDTTSTQTVSYTPNQVGTYSFVFSYPDLNYTWTNSATYRNDIFKGDTSKTFNLTVQQEQLAEPLTSYPLPTEYWTRPIEGQNTDWWTIASNWLGETHPQISRGIRTQPDGVAPNSAHVIWTKSIDAGGVVGGSNVGNQGNMFYSGLAYQGRFQNPIIMNGQLFYSLPLMDNAAGAGYMGVDLRTGQTLWQSTTIGIATTAPSFGYLFDFDDENQHGVIPPGMLFASNFAYGYDPATGTLRLNVTNVPSGTSVLGPNGEILRYQINISSKWLAQWNSSKVIWPRSGLGVAQPATVNASLPSCYDWNITLPSTIPTNNVVQFAVFNDIIVGGNSFPSFGDFMTTSPYTMWAISLKPENRGQLVWMQNYTVPDGVTRRQPTVDTVNRVFILRDKEPMVFQGFSLDTGNHMWTTENIPASSDYEYFDPTFSGQQFLSAYGHLYSAAYGGLVYAYDTKDGSLLWVNGNDSTDPKNSTNSGLTLAYGRYPQFISAAADGKVFIETGEHSPDSPLWKGAETRALNATTGKEIWAISGYSGFPGRVNVAIADGTYVFNNVYNQQITAIGKGPSTITVDAPMTSNELGKSLVIRGTIMDISPGTKQNEQAARFPKGVPAVSDESQTQWMAYIYQQKPRPTDVTGVPVTISVMDANGNYRQIGTITSDTDGFFSLNWKPDIEGKYTVYANFAGSESYWPSHAVTAFVVDPVPATTSSPTSAPVQTMADLYLIPGIVAIIIAIAVVGAILGLLVSKKRP